MTAPLSAPRASVRVASYVLRARHRCLLAGGVVVSLVVAAQAVRLLLFCERFGLGETPTAGDVAAFALAGAVSPSPSELLIAPVRMLDLPFGWIVLAITPLAVTALLVPSGARDVVVEAAGSRAASLLGQCLAALAGCLTCWALVLFVCATMVAVLPGGSLTLDGSSWLVSVIGIALEHAARPPYEIAPALMGLVAVSLGLSVAQVGLTSVCGGRIALLATVVPVIAAPFAVTPALFGNFMMLARSTALVAVSPGAATGAAAALSPGHALLVALALSLFGVGAACCSLFRASR